MTGPYIILCRSGRRVPACVRCGAFPKYRDPGRGLLCQSCWEEQDTAIAERTRRKSPGGSRDDLYPES